MTVNAITISHSALNELHELLERCASDGLSFDTCHKQVLALIKRHDWYWFAASKIERRQRSLSLYKMVSAIRYAEHRRSQLVEENWSYWVFEGDYSCPSSHMTVDGVTLPPSDPFWLNHMPPLDWNCGCYVLGARSIKSARRLGGKPPEDFEATTLRQDKRGKIWRSGQPPDLFQILCAVINGEAEVRITASQTDFKM